MAAGTYRLDLVNLSSNVGVPSYSLNVRAPVQRTPDLDLQLLDSSGNVVAQPANHSQQPEMLTYANASAGTYSLRVTAKQYGGNFALDYSMPTITADTITYDADGRIAAVASPAGTTNYTFDNADRVAQITLPDAGVRSYQYFADGQVKQITDPTGTQSFTYKTNGELASATDQGQVLTSYGYDAAGNQSSITRAGQTIASTFDAANQLATRTTSLGTASFGYDGNGNVTSLTAAAGDYDQHMLDPGSQLSHVMYATSPTAPVSTDLGFEYDVQHNRVERANYAQTGPLDNYTYDTLNRLTQETYLVGGQTKTVSYAYDTLGNRTKMTNASGDTTYAYNPAGQLASLNDPAGAQSTYLYDASGNLSKTFSSAGVTAFGWTSTNSLARVASPGQQPVSFTYDANGLRRTKTVGPSTTTYSYELGHLISEASGSQITTYTYDDTGAPLTITLPSGQTYSYHYDEAGSVDRLTDANHNVVAWYAYDAWGNVVDTTGSQSILGSNPYTYRAKFGVRYDQETGLYLMGARYYDPRIGRFISADSASGAGTSYNYADSNPVTKIDPTGMHPTYDGGSPPPPPPDGINLTGRQRLVVTSNFFSRFWGTMARYGDGLGYGVGVRDFERWEISSGRIPMDSNRGGSMWWRGSNGTMVVAMNRALRDWNRGQRGSSNQSVDRWLRYANWSTLYEIPPDYKRLRNTQLTRFWRAHQVSLHAGIWASYDQFWGENSTEQSFANLATVVVDKCALKRKCRQTADMTGWLSMRTFLGHFYPRQYPARSIGVPFSGAQWLDFNGYQNRSISDVGVFSSYWS
jgi:RHS repeat-associated protein